MSSTLKESPKCHNCARPLPTGAPAGLCPACLLAQGAAPESGVAGENTRFMPPPLAEVAELFPQLEIVSLLGAGGMGAVYKARQPDLDRFVALKILPASADGGTNFSERFNREARALARLNHPNIVAVHEFGLAGRLHYFLMEFVDGANLRQLEQAGRLSSREVLQIIPQICDALQYAHDEGVVHRDIKPENVLLDRKGRVKIADFGLAKILGHDPEAARLTAEGQVMGTPHYMAPEQVERPLTVDHRADIYSLGVVFYEMLTGDLPLGKFAPPSRKVEVDVRLDEIVLRALENDPARRYQHASEVKQRVATVVETPGQASATSSPANGSGGTPQKPGVRYLYWAGIPAVVERDDERDVNFQGSLGVFFVMLMCATLAQQSVRWISGSEYAVTSLSFFAATMSAIWAIRRTLNQPWPDEPPRRTDNGTSILPPTRRIPYLWDYLMVVGLFVVVVGLHYIKTAILVSRQPAVSSAATAFAFQYGHVTEQSFDALIDFDTGRVADFPPAKPGAHPLAGIGEDILWAQENGFDAVAGNGELQLLDLELTPRNDTDWDTLPAQALVMEQWPQKLSHPRTLTPDHVPATYAYRTREQGFGLIQIVAFDPQRPGVTVRIKRVVRAGADPVARARQDTQTGALVASLPQGGSLALVAMGDSSQAPGNWWRADGRAVDGWAATVLNPQRLSGSEARSIDLLFQFQGVPGPSTTPVFQFEGAYRSLVGGVVIRSESQPSAKVPATAFGTSNLLPPVQVVWPLTKQTGTARVGIPLADWHMIGSYEPFSRSFTRTRTGDDPPWNIQFQTAANGLTGAQITVIFSAEYPQWNLRVIATRSRQAEIVGLIDASTTKGASTTRTYLFPGLTLAEVANFAVQAQPLHWVEFADLALIPRNPRATSRPATYTEVTHLDLDGWLDLDTGATSPANAGGRERFDMEVVAHRIRGLDLSGVELAPADWLTRSPEALELLLRDGRPLRATASDLVENQLPLTLGFRTRDGSAGILQVLELAPKGGGATVRFKRLKTSDTR